MELTYVGPFDEVEILETGQVVQRGGLVEVDDDLGRRLAEQDVWSEGA